MSSQPSTPSPDKAAVAEKDGGDWRASLPQASRSKEVREIATVLAQLEPGATQSSKLMLAMRFEDSVFKGAASYQDYRKKLDKRLAKLQKNYKSGQTPPPPSASGADENEETVLADLRNKYGPALKFIDKHANTAYLITKEKHGEDKAKHLKTHVDNARFWAHQLGLLPRVAVAQAPLNLDKLQEVLKTRLDNIRLHVLKLAQPDLFLQETLEKMEQTTNAKAQHALMESVKKQLESLDWFVEEDETRKNALAVLKQSLDKATALVPPPSRLEASQRDAAVQHLERMRAASTAIVAYLATTDKDLPDLPKDVFAKCYTTVAEGISFLKEVAPKLIIREESTKRVKLEDAWTKFLEFPQDDDNNNQEDDDDNNEPAPKRLKTTTLPFKSRVLLTSDRKVPSNLLPAIRRKRARLVQPQPHGQGSHIILDFDQAFVMTIYFVPLVVTIRAYDKVSAAELLNQNDNTTTITTVGGSSWTPIEEGLTETTSGNGQSSLSVWGVAGSYSSLGHIVEARLEHASAHATLFLRKCFAKEYTYAKRTQNDFEVEIEESSALLRFLQIAHQTYQPNWTDDEDV